MITTAVIALAATASTGQIKGRTAYGPYGPWTDGIAARLNTPATMNVVEGANFTVQITGSDEDEYIEVTNNPNPKITQIGNWQTVRVAPGNTPGSTAVSQQYINGSGANVTVVFTRKANTYGLPVGGYPVYATDTYDAYDGQDNTASPTNPNYVLWDSNDVPVSVALVISKKP